MEITTDLKIGILIGTSMCIALAFVILVYLNVIALRFLWITGVKERAERILKE